MQIHINSKEKKNSSLIPMITSTTQNAEKLTYPQSEIFRRVYGDYAWNSPTTVTFPTNIVFFGIPQINDHSSNHILYVH